MKSGKRDICPNFNLCLYLYRLRKNVLHFIRENKCRGERTAKCSVSLPAILTRGPQADMGLYHHLLRILWGFFKLLARSFYLSSPA